MEGLMLRPDDWRMKLCERTIAREISIIRTHDTPVVFSQAWANYPDTKFQGSPVSDDKKSSYSRVQHALEDTIADFSKSNVNRKFLIIGAQIIMDQCTFDKARMLPAPLPRAPYLSCPSKPREEAVSEGTNINEMLGAVQKKFPDRVKLLLPVDFLCDADCPAVKDDLWLYTDSGHFTVAGSLYIAERAHAVLADLLTPQPDQRSSAEEAPGRK
jgi:hypothetical protein